MLDKARTVNIVKRLDMPHARQLSGVIKHPPEITTTQRRQMYALLNQYFDNVTQSQFEEDLTEKEWVVLLSDSASGKIQGFSTLMRLQTMVNDQPIVAFFSGDTIIHRRYWGETELPRIWGRHVFRLAETIREARVYWFLISSGYKTYRFLPVFFREFYPTYRCQTPAPIKQTIDSLAQLKFPEEYDRETGLIRFSNAVRLSSGIAKITNLRLKDPHVAFFVDANPGHAQGDELVCLTEITPTNLTRAGRRMLGIRKKRGGVRPLAGGRDQNPWAQLGRLSRHTG